MQLEQLGRWSDAAVWHAADVVHQCKEREHPKSRYDKEDTNIYYRNNLCIALDHRGKCLMMMGEHDEAARAYLAMRDVAQVELRGKGGGFVGGLSAYEVKELQMRRQEAYGYLGALHAACARPALSQPVVSMRSSTMCNACRTTTCAPRTLDVPLQTCSM